jgi:hypothetical protein
MSMYRMETLEEERSSIKEEKGDTENEITPEKH